MYRDDVTLAGRVLGELMEVERVPPCTVTAMSSFIALKYGRKTSLVEREIREKVDAWREVRKRDKAMPDGKKGW